MWILCDVELQRRVFWDHEIPEYIGPWTTFEKVKLSTPKKKQPQEMQASYGSVSSTKKLGCVKSQFSYRVVYPSCIIPEMSLDQVWTYCKMRVAEIVQKNKGCEGEKNSTIS